MSMEPLRVCAHLATPILANPPKLDALLELRLSMRMKEEAYNIERPGREIPWPRSDELLADYLARTQGVLPDKKAVALWEHARDGSAFPLPLGWERIGPWRLPRVSNPILISIEADTVRYVAKRIGTQRVEQVHPVARGVLNTTGGWTKSYRLPMRQRAARAVVWFAFGHGSAIRKELQRIEALGKKTSIGGGVVAKWEVTPIDQDYSWTAYNLEQNARVLMRTLPVEALATLGDCIGWKRSFGACVAPYWHPDRYTEIIEPC